MKIAIVHDYLHTYGGGEKVLELFHELYPEAPIYTLLYVPDALPVSYRKWNIISSWMNHLPFKKQLFKMYVPLMPIAIESFDFSEFDVVISISAGFAKGILSGLNTSHFSYTLTVPRFLWGYETSTIHKHKKNLILGMINNYLRIWDKTASDRVDFFIANSNTVAERIGKAYGRNANVIYTPVDEEIYTLSQIEREVYYVIVSRLEAYKHIDLAVKTCVAHNLKLKIIGDGQERKSLEKLGNENVEFLGFVADATKLRYIKSAKALLFPGADDLGLVPIEAQMCGTPVIAYKKDGAKETIIDGVSGYLFDAQTEESLYLAIQKLDTKPLQPHEVRNSVMRFAKTKIKKDIESFISASVAEYKKTYHIE